MSLNTHIFKRSYIFYTKLDNSKYTSAKYPMSSAGDPLTGGTFYNFKDKSHSDNMKIGLEAATLQ